MKKVLVLSLILLFQSCAIIVNGSRQNVFIKGGPEKGITKLKTPDGTFEVENGSAAVMLTRSRSDIPVTITCPDSSKKVAIIETRFDWLKGGVGNILNGGLGWFIDPFSEDAFVISDFSLASYCK